MNITKPRGHGTDALFHSPAFIMGFGDYRAGRAFKYPEARGPHGGRRSSEIAYERGRQFGALWAGKPVAIKAMLEGLERAHRDRIIL